MTPDVPRRAHRDAARSGFVVLAAFTRAGVDNAALAARLQREGAQSFAKSWQELMDCIATKSSIVKKIARA